jgi:hypothetical protein
VRLYCEQSHISSTHSTMKSMKYETVCKCLFSGQFNIVFCLFLLKQKVRVAAIDGVRRVLASTRTANAADDDTTQQQTNQAQHNDNDDNDDDDDDDDDARQQPVGDRQRDGSVPLSEEFVLVALANLEAASDASRAAIRALLRSVRLASVRDCVLLKMNYCRKLVCVSLCV